MKLTLHIFLLLLICNTGFAQNDLPDKALKAYKEKHYKEAVGDYEELVRQGFQSSKLYYNLGNAYYRNNQLGKAIYSYELAHKLNPADEDITTNLEIANSKTIDKIETKTNFFANVLKARLVNGLNTTQWAWLSIVALLVSLALLFGFISAYHPIIKRICFFSGSLVFLVFITAMILGFVALNNKQQIKFAIITAKECKIYNEPQDSDKQKFSLHEGTKLKVLETNDDWTSIQLENGNEGWVKTNEIGLF